MIQVIKKITFCFVVGGLLSLVLQVGAQEFGTGTFQREDNQDKINIGTFGATTGVFHTPDGKEWNWEGTSSPVALGSDHVMHYEIECHKGSTCPQSVSGTGVIRFSYDSANQQYILKSVRGDDRKYHSRSGFRAYYKKVK